MKVPKNRFNIPLHEKDIFKLADDMVTWSKQEDTLFFEDFALMHDISPFRLRRIDNEYFQDKLDIALMNLSSKRERITFLQRGNTRVWEKTYPLYNKEYRQYEREKDKTLFESAKQLIVNIPGFLEEKKECSNE